jgi:hypothetical protein
MIYSSYLFLLVAGKDYMSKKNSNDAIEERNHELSVVVPQPTAQLRAPTT